MIGSGGAAGRTRDAGRSGQAPSQGRFGDLRIGVVCRRDPDGEHLIRLLQRTRAAVTGIWPAPEQIPVDFDCVFSVLLPDLPQRLPWLPGMASAALTVILPHAGRVDMKVLRNCAPHSIIHLPASDAAVEVSLMMARDHFSYERRLNARIEKLDENLRTMRAVERAKAILMKQRGLSEDEAYHFLRLQAMSKRVSIGALSTAIIDSQELLSYV
jgi:AmiR/NasT family two-component response regulator